LLVIALVMLKLMVYVRTIELNGTIRDCFGEHPDFESAIPGWSTGCVQSLLITELHLPVIVVVTVRYLNWKIGIVIPILHASSKPIPSL
jgi:hypothetical protein